MIRITYVRPLLWFSALKGSRSSWPKAVGAGLQELVDSNFELVVIDCFLQDGMGGFELIRMLREHDPSLSISAISSVAPIDLLTKYPELSDVIGLSKPFRPTELNACR
ncbi:response regulator [Bradyrhizobium sp. sBnM-33]|uniref:response regulator n=1 Tax=Bradyrhizobium sp. sBnM-33 TaxID=2831780 RepID=UPI001BCF4D60|nr:response regulator [Bradyrhizobium sp. sBnM-33]